jgi:ATP-dependent DNA helicase RecG
MNDSFIIKNLLDQPEGVRLELKSQLDFESIAKVITSFVNTSGGDLIIGVNEDKTVSSSELSEQDKIKISDFLIQKIKPTVPISINLLPYKNKALILISVWEGSNKPYSFKNSIYVRQGSVTKIGSTILNAQLLNQQVDLEQRWERQAVLGASIEDLDLDEIQKSITSYKNYSASDDDYSNPEQFLISRGLIVNGNVTNACMVLFGENPTQFIPQSIIKLVVHPGTKSGDNFKENKIYSGNLFKNVRNILTDFDAFIGKDNIIEGVLRTVKRRFPELSLREGLLNAIVHREYSASQSFLAIEIFSDRLVISNYGGLQNNMTVSDLKKEHNSILRNPDIAQMCFYNRLIEMMGTGTLRMIRNCKEEGFEVPKWKNTNNILELTFPGVKHQYEGVNEGVNSGIVSERFRNDFGMISERIRNDFGTSIQETFEIIVKYPNYSAEQIANETSKTSRTIENHLQKLKEAGYIERIGPKLGGYWEVKNEN